MITVRLKGGMGNQMFQYALGRALSLKYGTDLALDLESFGPAARRLYGGGAPRTYDLDLLTIQARPAQSGDVPWMERFYWKGRPVFSAMAKKLGIFQKGKEKFFQYDPRILGAGPHAYLDGYWQSPKYFLGIENVIRQDFKLRNDPAPLILELEKEIRSLSSLCVHVRRGDYVGNPHHEVVGKEYYRDAVKKIEEKAAIDKIYVFSDDIRWCEENLLFDHPTMFVGNEYAGTRAEGHLFLMSGCRNFIIPNSSFSWWAAWLSERPDKIVVCPKQWFPGNIMNTDDLAPDSWIRI